MPIQAMAMAVLITALIGAMADALAAELIGDGTAGIKRRGYRSRIASFATLRAMRLLHAHSARLAAFHPVSATVIALQAASAMAHFVAQI